MTDLQNLLQMPLPQADAQREDRPDLPPDHVAREAALDIAHSWIVQAPAGAGKTELLTQRFLTLLATVEEPEEILAITFTRAATAEMRGRIVAALEQAARSTPATGEPRSVILARLALANSTTRGWQLLEQPHRLDVQTIDSLCLRLAHSQPLLSRLGGRLEPTEQAAPFYTLAAERTLGRIGRAPAELEAALEHLLLLRDNNLGDCQSLIAEMLERREQWRHVFVLSEQAAIDWEEVRASLEAPFAEEVRCVLAELHAIFVAQPILVAELLELAQYACANGSHAQVHLLDGLQALPSPHADFLAHWGCLRNFMLTQEGAWRKSVSVREGFPPDGNGMTRAERTRYKLRMTGLLNSLQREGEGERLRELLCSVTMLPAAAYDETQWRTLLSVFRVLRHAVAELHVIFAERNQVDFAELSIAAATVLDDQENTRGLLASEAKRHLLVDEFQDTSRRQHQLIGRLLREWQPGDGRTCFLVGDPMQSIYIFRQAEVELFGRVQRNGLDCGHHTHPCSGLRLSENFRSHAGLVEPLNRYFQAIFGEPAAGQRGDVPFAPSTAAAPGMAGLDAVQVHPFFCSAEEPEGGAAAQVARVVELVEQELPRIRAAQETGLKSYTVAILGRAKSHLSPIARALRAGSIAFRAVELETLAERQEILDLQSLLSALLHPMDRIAWLSVLRAPWCGLSLGDLHALTGSDDRGFRYTPVTELIAQRTHLLTADGRQRLDRVARLMALAAAGSGPSLAAWIERTWTSLGGPAYLNAEERENAETFFRLLDGLSPDGIDVLNGSLATALGQLCAAPDASASEHFGVQLMTMHKAKGLGFEVVIVPSLECKPGGDSAALVTMLERVRRGSDEGEDADEVLVAPLGSRGEQHRTYKWVQAQRRQREAGERKRLFYVACTRARRQLHLLGTAEITAAGRLKPGASDSLLACAWPALGPIFGAQQPASAGSGLPLPVRPAVLTPIDPPEPGLLERLAATGTTLRAQNDLRLSRVPSGFAPAVLLANVTSAVTFPHVGNAASSGPDRMLRPEGSFESRARGSMVHAMLESVSAAWAREGRAGDLMALEPRLERIARTGLRSAGLAPARVAAITAPLVATVLAVAADAEGRWILGPHPGAHAEWSLSSWSGSNLAETRLRNLRVDRTFLAGDKPLAEGAHCRWVIDYKTGAEPGAIALDAWLEAQKEQWRPQLEGYGSALQEISRDRKQLRYGLYFPELLRLKSWGG